MVMGSPIVNQAAPAFYREVDACGVKVALKLLAGKWMPIIFYHLRGGPLRFTELWHEILRLSKKVLVGQLRQLEEAGLVARTVYNGFPPEVSYQLTPKGNGLVPIMHSLDQWAMTHVAEAVHIS
jgi:DNA-binding HxlR family transcriptional regulator